MSRAMKGSVQATPYDVSDRHFSHFRLIRHDVRLCQFPDAGCCDRGCERCHEIRHQRRLSPARVAVERCNSGQSPTIERRVGVRRRARLTLGPHPRKSTRAASDLHAIMRPQRPFGGSKCSIEGFCASPLRSQ